MQKNHEADFAVQHVKCEMRSALAARLQVLVERAGGSGALSRKAGVPPSTLATYLSGEAEPKALRLARLAKAGNVTIHWLATGEGPMEEGHHVGEPVVAYGVRPEAIAALGELRDFVLVPRYDIEASAGPGRAVQRESEVGRVAFRKDWLRGRGVDPVDANIIRIVGDSMEPEIPDGALVLVDTAQERLGPDGIYVLLLDGDVVAKRLQRDLATGGVIVHSENRRYSDQTLTAEQAENLHIIGRVIWIAKEI